MDQAFRKAPLRLDLLARQVHAVHLPVSPRGHWMLLGSPSKPAPLAHRSLLSLPVDHLRLMITAQEK